jgi:hypothetical protein
MSIDFRFHYSHTEDRLAVTATDKANQRVAVMYLTRLDPAVAQHARAIDRKNQHPCNQ